MNLVDILQVNLIKFPLEHSQKVDVINELLTLLTENKMIIEKEPVLQAVLAREEIMSTGVGNGVAIPHCKTKSCPDFSIAMGIHHQGIDFNSLDQKPANIIFLLVGPENKPGVHIRLLSRISRIISKENVRNQILSCSSSSDVFDLLLAEEKDLLAINA